MDPVVLFFLLGVFAKLAKSDLRLPESLYETLSIYLLLAIGIKGGVELAQQPLGTVLPQAVSGMALGASIPLLLYPVLRRLGRLPAPDSASIAAHYGSVSVVTFAVALSYLLERQVDAESYLPLMAAVMEAPGIIAGIILARRATKSAAGGGATRWRELAHEVLVGKSVLLLLGGLLIGAVAGPEGVEPIEPVFIGMFKGVLALFLLEMGLVAGARLGDLKRAGLFLIVFGLAAPPVLGVLGAVVGHLVGLSVGGTAILATLAASASYIAAPTRCASPCPRPTRRCRSAWRWASRSRSTSPLVFRHTSSTPAGSAAEPAMNVHPKKLLVIISEAALEKSLIRDARKFGAHGYTISEVRGGGEHGERESAWEADRSIEMKVICDEEVAEKLALHVLATYAPNYAVTLFTSDVGVFRPKKF